MTRFNNQARTTVSEETNGHILKMNSQTSCYAVSSQPCYVTTDGIRPKKSPRFLGGRRYQRQVSWLAIFRLNSTFPADASGRIELKQIAYSCGSSHGLALSFSLTVFPFSPPRGGTVVSAIYRVNLGLSKNGV